MILLKPNVDRIRRRLSDRAKKQIPIAIAQALTATSTQVVLNANAQIKQRIHEPTPFVMRAIQKLDPNLETGKGKAVWATKDRLFVTVGLRRDRAGKGSSWYNVMAHHFNSGSRKFKRMEARFMHAGILPPGMAMSVPRTSSWAVKLTSSGDIMPSFVSQLISYFGAYKMVGDKNNMLESSKKRIARVGKTESGYKTIRGVKYFVANANTRNLASGIWAKRGTHGVDVAPVLLFIKKPKYKKRLDLKLCAQQALRSTFGASFRKYLLQAIATAK